MATDDLLSRVLDRMRATATPQRRLAAACGLNQAHLSKVLRGLTPLAPKTRLALTEWLDQREGSGDAPPSDDVRKALDRLLAGPEPRRRRMMQFLVLLDALTR